MLNSESTTKQNNRYKSIPWIFSLISAIFWGLIFILFGQLHGMWEMFENDYPLFFANVLGVVTAKLSGVQAVLFAMLDGAVAGWLIGWLVRSALRKVLSQRTT